MSQTRTNYYENLSADYSTPEPVPVKLADQIISEAEKFVTEKQDELPEISSHYSLEQIEAENKAWWPTHCNLLTY